jgi:hypothetical protein
MPRLSDIVAGRGAHAWACTSFMGLPPPPQAPAQGQTCWTPGFSRTLRAMRLLYLVSIVAVPGLPLWAVNAMGGAAPHAAMARALLWAAALWASAVGMAWLCNDTGAVWVRIPAGVLLGTYVFVGLPQSLHWVATRPHPAPPAAASPAVLAPEPAPTRPPTFREVFNHDFPGLPALARNVGLQSAKTGEKTAVPVRMLVELNTREKFLSVFLDRHTSSFNSCVFFLYNIDLVFQEMATIPIESHVPNAAAALTGKDFAFDHNIYFYMADDMTSEAQAYLEKAFRDQGMFVHFRGAAYYAMHWRDEDLQQPVNAEEAVR